MAVAAPLEFYRVELEVASKAGDGTMQYTYAPYGQSSGVSETEAQTAADEMKSLGIGGRIVHLDGTPEGKVLQTWGSVERAAAAEKIEKGALGK
jgi:hypothetical protein